MIFGGLIFLMATQSYYDLVNSVPGLTHYYSFNSVDQAKDLKGNVNGTLKGSPKFSDVGVTFDGKSYIELPDHADFSAATTGDLTIVVYQTVSDWTRVSQNNEYLHWMGKGRSNTYEWTFRIYIDGGGGEAPTRHRRTSFYAYNNSGGLGAGSFFQDENDGPGTVRIIGGQISRSAGVTRMYKNGVLRDTDKLSDYNIVLKRASAPVDVGTRGDNSGYLVGTIRRLAFYNRALTAAEMKTIADGKNLPDGGPGQSTGEGAATVPTPPVVTTGGTRVRIGTAEHAIDGVDTARGTDQLIMYTPNTGKYTTTNEWGTEVGVRTGQVVSVVRQGGGLNEHIPSDGYVLSGHGTSRTWLDTNGILGAKVEII